MSRTWILTGSPENHAAVREHGDAVAGLPEPCRVTGVPARAVTGAGT